MPKKKDRIRRRGKRKAGMHPKIAAQIKEIKAAEKNLNLALKGDVTNVLIADEKLADMVFSMDGGKYMSDRDANIIVDVQRDADRQLRNEERKLLQLEIAEEIY